MYIEDRWPEATTKESRRSFQVGDLVLKRVRLNTKEPKDGKLGPNWEGSCVIAELHKNRSYGLVGYKGKKVPRSWNTENKSTMLNGYFSKI